jgi:hypothetical protein
MPQHQTTELGQYNPALQQRCSDLFQRVEQRVTPARTVQQRGSYSICGTTSRRIAAKIVIYEAGLRLEGDWQPGADGVYVCLRTPGNAFTHHLTVVFRPNYDERFAWFLFVIGQNPDHLADFITACADV